MINRYGIRLATPMSLALWVTGALALALWAAAVSTPLAVAFAVATAVTWATGLRAAVLWWRAAASAAVDAPTEEGEPLRIALLYCVADDFQPRAILASMEQDVPVSTVILDDSRTAAGCERVDAFARTHACRVIRRADRSGYKAGNLNHAVDVLRGQFDAYLVCDSDVVLPTGLAGSCARALADATVAVAQAAPVAAPGRTRFARYFGPLLATHLETTRRGRAAIGVTSFLGRGALIRASAIDDVGGFPVAVAEDLALTVALRGRGWRLVDVAVAFTEDYPIDYRAFRTQLRKTAEGAVEFLRAPGAVRHLERRERWDVLIETALVPASAVAGATTLVFGAALAVGGAVPPPWILLISAVSAILPLLPEAVRRARAQRFAAGAAFAVIAGALYASTVFVVVAAVIATAAGRRAVFRVTPKEVVRVSVGERLALVRAELIVVPVLMALTVAASGSALAAGGVLGPVLLVLAFALPSTVPRLGRSTPSMSDSLHPPVRTARGQVLVGAASSESA